MTRAFLFFSVVLVFAMSLGGCGKGEPLELIVHPLVIRTHSTTSLSQGEADSIVSAATTIVQTANSSGDTACRASFVRQSLESFSIGNGVVNSQADFNSLFTRAVQSSGDPSFGLTRQVRVIFTINWCGALAPNIIGCADTPGVRMVVVRYSSGLEGILWAHELGHTKGLGHRDQARAIMHSIIGSDHLDVTGGECDAYRRKT